MTTPSQKLARLRDLMESAKANYFERITLAHELMLDKAWIDSEHRGDVDKAAQALEDLYFHDLCGLLSLWNLITIVQKFPTPESWKKYKHNLRVMFDKCRRDAKPKKVTPAKPKKPEQQEIEWLKETVHKKDKELRNLRAEVTELRRENRKLKKRLRKIENIMAGEPVEV